MKRNSLTLIVSALILLIFVSLLISFQVRRTDVALVTRFGKPTRNITDPGLYFKWPYPIEKVQKYDKRTQDLEGKFEETYTQDKINVIVWVYAGWSITNPTLFRERFNDSVDRARRDLNELIRSAQNAVVAAHPFSELISADPSQIKFAEIEDEILKRVQPQALASYGIEVKFLGIKRIGLPENITQKVFDRMKAERQRVVDSLTAKGDQQAADIRSEANSKREVMLAEANARVIELQGEAEAAAASSYEILNQNPELGLFLINIRGLKDVLKDRTTLILDQRTPPLQYLDGMQNRTEK
jgi:modulator of FtsH protease HflC